MAGVNEDRLVRLFMDLVQIYSPSYGENDVNAVLAEEMRSLGMEVRDDRSGPEGKTGNLIGLLRGNGQGVPIFLSGHSDTVEPGRNIKPVLDNGVVRSDGTTILGSDDKAPVASILEAVRVVVEVGIPHGDIEVIISYAEEKGLQGAKTLDTSLLHARYGFVADSGAAPGTLVDSAPSQDTIRAVFHGRPAHSGVEPEKGINALKAASIAIANMPLGRIDEETTANIGLISGGSGRNVVPDRIELDGEARSRDAAKLDKQTKAMVDAMQAAADQIGATLELDIHRQYKGYRLDETTPGMKLAMRAAEDVGLKPALVPTGGGTDANIYNAAGIESVVVGTGMSQVHTLEEHIAVKDMVDLSRHLIAIVKRAAQA